MDAPPFPTPGVSGTAGVFRRTAFERASGFAGSFFAWYEDADLSLRLLRGGFRFACVPAARARHEGSATGRRTPEVKWRLLFANRARTLRRNLSAGARLRALLVRPVPLPGLRGAIHELGPWRTLRAAALGGWDLLSSIPEDRAVRRAGPLLTRLPG
jgi:GT2 family glycosyltransferase